MAFEVRVSRQYVSFRREECRFLGADDHECTWLDGDSREIHPPSERVNTPDRWDLDEHGTPVEWAVWHLRSHYPELTKYRDGGPVPELVPAGKGWLSGEFQHHERLDADVTQTAAYLEGDWTDAQRTEIFRRVIDGHNVN